MATHRQRVDDIGRLASAGADAEADTTETGAPWSPFLAAVALLTLLALAFGQDPEQRRTASLVASPVLMAALTITTVRLVRLPGLGEPERRAWRTMLLAFGVFLLGGVAGVLMRLVPELPLQGPRQFGVTAGLLIMTAALFRFPAAPTHGLPRARFILDGLTIFAATSAFLWRFVLAPELAAGQMDVRLSVLVVLVVGCLAVLVVALALLLLRERSVGTREALVRLVVAVSIVLGLMLVTLNRGLGATAAPAVWQLGLNWAALLLVMSAAERQRLHVLRSPAWENTEEAAPMQALPYVAVSLVFGLLLSVGLHVASAELRGVLVGASVVAACVLVRQWLLLRENDGLRRQLELQAQRDPLTGMLNRRTWEAESEREVAKAVRSSRPLSVLMLDLDGFKQVNDANGHGAGDQVLRAVADCLEASIRRSDVAARMGGDEFVVLLPETEIADAVHLAEALCMRLARTKVEFGNVVLRLTVSVGVATLPPARDLRELLADADGALYAAKHGGRNRVMAARTAPRPVPGPVRRAAGEALGR